MLRVDGTRDTPPEISQAAASPTFQRIELRRDLVGQVVAELHEEPAHPRDLQAQRVEVDVEHGREVLLGHVEADRVDRALSRAEGDGAPATLVELRLVYTVSGGTRNRRRIRVGRPAELRLAVGRRRFEGPARAQRRRRDGVPSYPLGSAWVVTTLEWQPPLARLHDSLDLVAA